MAELCSSMLLRKYGFKNLCNSLCMLWMRQLCTHWGSYGNSVIKKTKVAGLWSQKVKAANIHRWSWSLLMCMLQISRSCAIKCNQCAVGGRWNS
jgi:hypothetical protein